MPERPVPAVACSPENHCITCGDDGVPMRVLTLELEPALALCEDPDGSRSTVDVQLVEPVAPGDDVLVHAGVALVRLEVTTA